MSQTRWITPDDDKGFGVQYHAHPDGDAISISFTFRGDTWIIGATPADADMLSIQLAAAISSERIVREPRQ